MEDVYKDNLLETVNRLYPFQVNKGLTKEEEIINELLILESINSDNEYLIEGIGDLVKNVVSKVKALKVTDKDIKKKYMGVKNKPGFKKAKKIIDNIVNGKSAMYKGEPWYYLVVPLTLFLSSVIGMAAMDSLQLTILKAMNMIMPAGEFAASLGFMALLVYLLVEWAPASIYKLINNKKAKFTELIKKDIDAAEEGTIIQKITTGMKLVGVVIWIILTSIAIASGTIFTAGSIGAGAGQAALFLFVLSYIIRLVYRVILAWKTQKPEEVEK